MAKATKNPKPDEGQAGRCGEEIRSQAPALRSPRSRIRPRRSRRQGQGPKGREAARKVAKNPMTTEVVAATLVAAAAALRVRKRRRRLPVGGRRPQEAAKTGVDGGALWQLALDVARRSIDAIGKEDRRGKEGEGQEIGLGPCSLFFWNSWCPNTIIHREGATRCSKTLSHKRPPSAQRSARSCHPLPFIGPIIGALVGGGVGYFTAKQRA